MNNYEEACLELYVASLSHLLQFRIPKSSILTPTRDLRNHLLDTERELIKKLLANGRSVTSISKIFKVSTKSINTYKSKCK